MRGKVNTQVETDALLAIHAHSAPVLDTIFRFSDRIGTLLFFSGLVLGIIAWHLSRGERREARLWLFVGLSTVLLQEGIKLAVGRPRPQLWPHLVSVTAYAFPSGHALASATLYPLLAWIVSRRSSAAGRWAAMAASILVAVFVGFGRLYLGVHWPSDVLAGWGLGAVQVVAAIRWLERSKASSR